MLRVLRFGRKIIVSFKHACRVGRGPRDSTCRKDRKQETMRCATVLARRPGRWATCRILGFFQEYPSSIDMSLCSCSHHTVSKLDRNQMCHLCSQLCLSASHRSCNGLLGSTRPTEERSRLWLVSPGLMPRYQPLDKVHLIAISEEWPNRSGACP